jgi:hypothetical protein
MLVSVTDRVVVNTAAIRDYLIRMEGLDSAKIEVIHNGVPVFQALLGPDIRTVMSAAAARRHPSDHGY